MKDSLLFCSVGVSPYNPESASFCSTILSEHDDDF